MNFFKKFRNIGRWHQLMYSVYILTLIGLVVYPWTWLVWALVFFVPMYHAISVIAHDYICHNYIRPRNKLFEILCLGFFSILLGETLLSKKNYHIHHHRYLNTDDDPTQARLKNNSLITYILELYQTPFNKPIDQVANRLSTDIEIWFEEHTRLVFYVGIVLSFILMPLWLFVVLHVYCRFLLFVGFKAEEYYFHKTISTDLSKDKSFLVIFIGGSAWHSYHHIYREKPFYGDGIWKYLNLSWYFTKFMFAENKSNIY